MKHAAPPTHSVSDVPPVRQEFSPAAVIPALVVGTSPTARYLAECVALHSGFELVGITSTFEPDSVTTAEQQNAAPGEHHGPDRQRMLVVLACAGDRAEAIDHQAQRLEEETCSALKCGHDVLLTGEHGLTPDAIGRVSVFAADAGRMVRAWRPSLASVRFRTLRQVVASGEAGQIRSMRLVHHALRDTLLPSPGTEATVAMPVPGTGSATQAESRFSRASDERGCGVLLELVSHRLAEFFAVGTPRVVRVAARLSFARPLFDPLTAISDHRSVLETGCMAWLETEDGMLASLDIDLACVTHVTTDWWIQGTRGGYRSGWQSLTAPDGEVFEVPVSQPTTARKPTQPGTDRPSSAGGSHGGASSGEGSSWIPCSDEDFAWQELHALLADSRSRAAPVGGERCGLAIEHAIARTIAAIQLSHAEGRFVDCDIQAD